MINDVSTNPQETPTTASERHTNIEGRWLLAACVLWAMLVLKFVGLFMPGLIPEYNFLPINPASILPPKNTSTHHLGRELV